MHGFSGVTSHCPLKVPPQGPLRMFFGHVIGQTYSIKPRTQLPQAWHPKTGFLKANSAFSKACAAAGRWSIQRRMPVKTVRKGAGVLAGSMTSKSFCVNSRGLGGGVGES